MGKLVKKLSVIVVCLSLVLGVMGVNGGVVAKASVNSDSIIVCNIYKSNENTVATIQVKVWKARYEAHGVTLAFSNGDDSTAKTYHISALGGTVYFPDGNYATVQYLDDYYEIVFVIYRNTIPEQAAMYIYSGEVETDINGRFILFV